MTRPRVLVCAVPASAWIEDAGLPGTVARFARDALTTERRIRKEVAQEEERQRYAMLCGRLEREVLASPLLEVVDNAAAGSAVLARNRLPAILVGADYLHLLGSAGEEFANARIGHTFVPPDQLADHLATFLRLCGTLGDGHGDLKARIDFLEVAVSAGCGIVEAQDPYGPDEPTSPRWLDDAADRAEVQRTRSGVPAPTLTAPDLDQGLSFADGRKRDQVARLSATILTAVRHGDPVSFSNRANDVIAEVLHRFVYVAGGSSETTTVMRIAYADGSEGEPFPIRCLPQRDAADEVILDMTAPIRAVLMSMRHDDLDREVEFAWFRNRDVSQSRFLAETDAYCDRTTYAMLLDGVREGPFVLDLFHTGFEPAVIGFYRAVVRAIGDGLPVVVRPFYYRGRRSFELGSWWL